MKSKNFYYRIIPLYYFFFFGGQSLITSYMNVYLEKSLGFSGSQLGLYTSITPLIPAAVIPLIGILCDRTQKYKQFFLCFIGIAMGSVATMTFQTTLPMVLLLGVMIETSHSATVSLADTQITEYCSQTGGNYGLFRMGGSIGWVVFGVLIGYLTNYLPLNKLLFPTYLMVTGIALCFAFLFPNITLENRKVHNQSSDNAVNTAGNSTVSNPLSLLFHNKAYMSMLLVTIVACMAGEASLAYIGNHLVTTMGASESLIGLNTAFCVVPEFLFFPAVNGLIKKFGFKKMYLLAAVGATLRFTIYFLSGNPYVFLLGSLFHCFGSGCLTAINLAHTHKVVDSRVFGTAVTLSSTVATVSRAIYGYFYGYIYESFGSRYIFLSVLPLCIFSVIFVLRSNVFYQKNQ
ncbi:MAG: MFS transporter [Lachnospiraceae bacterium]|nr:MFS transporter [Lachnospiraceae bacterium]